MGRGRARGRRGLAAVARVADLRGGLLGRVVLRKNPLIFKFYSAVLIQARHDYSYTAIRIGGGRAHDRTALLTVGPGITLLGPLPKADADTIEPGISLRLPSHNNMKNKCRCRSRWRNLIIILEFIVSLVSFL